MLTFVTSSKVALTSNWSTTSAITSTSGW